MQALLSKAFKGKYMNYSKRSISVGALHNRLAILALCAMTLFSEPVHAQGVTADSITLGQSASLTGGSEELGREMKAGAEAYFNAVNDAGGVNGRKIKLLSIDDAGAPERTKANTLKLLNEDNVFALFG